MCADMEDDHERSREAAIEQLLLSAGDLMEEASPELAMRIEPTRHALEVRIRLVRKQQPIFLLSHRRRGLF